MNNNYNTLKMGSLKDEDFEELVPMVDSVFRVMNPDFNEPIDCREVLDRLNEIFCLNLNRKRQKMYKFIRFRWSQFKSHPIVRIKREHMNMREQNFIRNLKGLYVDEKDGVELVMEHSVLDGHSNEIQEGIDGETSSQLETSSNVETDEMDKNKVEKVKQMATKESTRAKGYVHKGLIKGSEKNIRFNKLVYKTNSLIYDITGLKQGTRFEIIKAIRDYIDEHDLKSKDPKAPDQFNCDEKLTAVFGNYFTFSRLRKIPAERLLKYRYGATQSNVNVITVNQDDSEVIKTEIVDKEEDEDTHQKNEDTEK